MLGRSDTQPAAQPRRRQCGNRRRRRQREEQHLRGAGEIAPHQRQRLGHQHHQRQIAADQQQRERAEGDRARRAELHPRASRAHPQREQYAHDPGKQPAQITQQRRIFAAQIGDGRKVQVIGKDARQRDHRPTQQIARSVRRPGIEVVQQHQRANRHQHVGEHPHIEGRPRNRRELRPAQLQAQHQRLAQLHQHQRDDDRADRLETGRTPVGGKHAEDRRHQRKVPRHDGELAGGMIGSEGCTEGTGHTTQPAGKGQRQAIRPRGITAVPDPHQRARTQRRARNPGEPRQQRHAFRKPAHRAPSGHRTTRKVWSRITKSRKGV